jgi:hypothetical protein
MRLNPDITAVDTEYGSMLLDERKGKYWHLNTTGALVVQVLSGGDPVERAVELIAEQFNAAPDSVRRDVDRMIEMLTANGLVMP